jgi:uncharacterized cupin superfamily protein
MEAVTHWDDLEVEHHELGPMNARWRNVEGVRLAMSRIDVAPGEQSTPAHVHTAEEEFFYVVRGDGLWWEDGATAQIGAGDVAYARPKGGAHTIIGGDDGIDVLAFGPRIDIELVHLPRPGVVRIGGVTLPAETKHQWLFEAEAGPVERAQPSPRPAHVMRARDVPDAPQRNGPFGIVRRGIGNHLGSRRTGLGLIDVDAGKRSYPFHCHSAEEELFVVLGGEGMLRLGDEEHPVRAGSVISRPSGSRVAHQFIAGDDGLELLAYSDVEPADMTFYPDSNRVGLRYLGVRFRVDPVGYWDGEV